MDTEKILKEHQPPLTVIEQIKNLKEIGLIINDDTYAEKILNDISYFRLIKAYSLKLKIKNGNYHQNVTFEHIVELYLFDANFRQLLFSQIEKVEVNTRCRIANYFSNKYGVLGYKDELNFTDVNYHREFLEDIQTELKRNSKSPFVTNFINNYSSGDLPLYALVEILSFGNLSKFYKNMKNPDKKAIAKLFNVGYTYLESWLENLAYVRNICAHYGRLYNAKLSKKPMLYSEYNLLGIRNDRIFSSLICLKHLLSPDNIHWKNFVTNLSALIEKYENIDIYSMGFPSNWELLLLNIKTD